MSHGKFHSPVVSLFFPSPLLATGGPWSFFSFLRLRHGATVHDPSRPDTAASRPRPRALSRFSRRPLMSPAGPNHSRISSSLAWCGRRV